MTNSKTRINRYRKLANQRTRFVMMALEEMARQHAKFYEEMMDAFHKAVMETVFPPPPLGFETPPIFIDPKDTPKGKTYAEAVYLAEQSRKKLFGDDSHG